MSQVLRIQLLIAFLCVALIVYFVLLGRIATEFIVSGRPAATGLGIGLMILPLIGVWVMVSTLRAGLAHQRLARIIHDEGMELDVSTLPRMPSGRIRRDAADELFQSVRAGRRAPPRQLAALVPAGPGLRLRRRPRPGPRGDEQSCRDASAGGAKVTKTLPKPLFTLG